MFQSIRGIVSKGYNETEEYANITLDDGTVYLVRYGVRGVKLDPILNALVGKNVAISGTIAGNTFILQGWHIIEKR